jgi:hypothetical protein
MCGSTHLGYLREAFATKLIVNQRSAVGDGGDVVDGVG